MFNRGVATHLFKIAIFITTISHFTIVLSLRDPILLSALNSQVPQHDFYESSRFLCRELPTCFRFASPVLGDFLVLVQEIFKTVYSGANLPQHIYITNVQMDNFFNFLNSLIYPVIAICFCFLLVKKLTDSFTTAILFLNLFLFLLSGQTIIWLSKLLSSSGLTFQDASTTQRLIDGLATFPTVFFQFYDYTALTILCVSVWFLSKFRTSDISLLTKFMIGLISTAFFENLGIVFFIAASWTDRDLDQPKSWKENLPIIFGSGFLILFIQIWSFFGHTNKPLFNTWKYYFLSNTSSLAAVSISLGLLLGLPLVFGLLFGRMIGVLIQPLINLNSRVKSATEGYLLGLAFSTVVGFFTSGLSAESGRQTLGLQFLILLLATLRATNLRFQRSLK